MRKNLKEARQKAGMTQKQVAEYLGVSQVHYQKIEYGKVLGKITHWDMLEDLFNVPQRKLRETEENHLDKASNQEKHETYLPK